MENIIDPKLVHVAKDGDLIYELPETCDFTNVVEYTYKQIKEMYPEFEYENKNSFFTIMEI